jgi:hypothetical protein
MRIILVSVFPLLFIVPTALAAQGSERTIGTFVYEASTDPMTDEDRSAIYTHTTDTSRRDRTAMLRWSCRDNRLSLSMATGVFLGREGADVRWRFDAAAPIDGYWMGSGSGTILTNVFDVEDFSRDAMAATRLVLQATDFRGVTYTFHFVLEQTRNAMSLLPCAATVLE